MNGSYASTRIEEKKNFPGLDHARTGARGVMIRRPSRPAIPTFQVVAMIAGGVPGTIRGYYPEAITKHGN
jgi:hypothetical protein